MTTFAISKVLSSLPGALEANMVYLVRVGTGFDFYVVDSTGSIAYKTNVPGGQVIGTTKTGFYGFVLGDANTCIPFNLSSPNSAAIATNASVAFPIGTELSIRQAGSAAVHFSANTGVTFNAPNGTATTAVGDWRMAVKVGTDEWDIL